MKNILYAGTYLYAVNSDDGETPSQWIVTEEVNGFAVWHRDADRGVTFEEFFDVCDGREKAIELAVSNTLSALRGERVEVRG